MPELTRRTFLITGAAIGGVAASGLVVGVGYLSTLDIRGLQGGVNADGTVNLTAWIKIAADGHVTVAVPRTEMGQGIHTALAMLVAEELELPFDSNHISTKHPAEPLPVHTNFALGLDTRPEEANGPLFWIGKRVMSWFPFVVTGGSTSVVGAWQPLRIAGASARLMLLAAAADSWQVPQSECSASAGFIMHKVSDRQLSYGELASAAAQIAPTPDPPLKPSSDYKLLGKPVARLDTKANTTGVAQFAIDVSLPNMLNAAIRHSPVFGGTVKSVQIDKIREQAGVVEVVNLGDAVAVIAESYWLAQQAVTALSVEFDNHGNDVLDSSQFHDEMIAIDFQENNYALLRPASARNFFITPIT